MWNRGPLEIDLQQVNAELKEVSKGLRNKGIYDYAASLEGIISAIETVLKSQNKEKGR